MKSKFIKGLAVGLVSTALVAGVTACGDDPQTQPPGDGVTPAPQVFAITLNANGGDLSQATIANVAVGANIYEAIADVTGTKTPAGLTYRLVGFNMGTADGARVDATTVMPEENVTLFAVWERVASHAVTFAATEVASDVLTVKQDGTEVELDELDLSIQEGKSILNAIDTLDLDITGLGNYQGYRWFFIQTPEIDEDSDTPSEVSLISEEKVEINSDTMMPEFAITIILEAVHTHTEVIVNNVEETVITDEFNNTTLNVNVTELNSQLDDVAPFVTIEVATNERQGIIDDIKDIVLSNITKDLNVSNGPEALTDYDISGLVYIDVAYVLSEDEKNINVYYRNYFR